MDLIRNDWKHLKLNRLKRKISFKALYSSKGTRKVKDFQKPCNKETYLVHSLF